MRYRFAEVVIITFCVISDIKKNRLDKFLAQQFSSSFSRSKIKNFIESGFVFINGKSITSPDYCVKLHEEISINDSTFEALRSADFSLSAPPIPDSSVHFSILYEDEDIVVVNKPAGIVVHPGAGNYSHTLVNGLVFHIDLPENGNRPGIVHRIDKDTSGILVVAKNDRALANLSAQFQIHSIKRKYICFCYSVPRLRSGKIETFISRDSQNRLRMSVSNDERGKKAVSLYRVLKEFSVVDSEAFSNTKLATTISKSSSQLPFASKIECELFTGRTHQIRVHMSHIGNSLIGDSLYKKKNYAIPKEIEQYIHKFPRQALHAYFLEFDHPNSGKRMSFEVELPEDLKELEQKMSEVKFQK